MQSLLEVVSNNAKVHETGALSMPGLQLSDAMDTQTEEYSQLVPHILHLQTHTLLGC
jgi:hypothetical protein